MTKLILLVSPSKFDQIEIEKSSCVYCPNDEAYIVPEGIEFETIEGLQDQIEYYKTQSERRLKGLMYWKGKSE